MNLEPRTGESPHKLVPGICPQCGSDEIEVERAAEDAPRHPGIGTLDRCVCQGCRYFGPFRKTANEAITAWNLLERI